MIRSIEDSLLFEEYQNQRVEVESQTQLTLSAETVDEELNDEEFQVEHKVVEVSPEQMKLQQLIADIDKIFEGQMKQFAKALRKRNLRECKNINARLRRIFSSIDIRCQAMETFFERLDQMSQQIKELEQTIQAETQMKKKEIWDIQQIFKAQMHILTKKMALGMYDESLTIYERLSSAINSFKKDMPFVKDFKRKLNEIEARLSNCGVMGRASA